MATTTSYRVLLHNDSSTPMEFVVAILVGVYGHDQNQAIELMREVHTGGMTEVARLPLEAALASVHQLHALAAEAGVPLMASISPEHPMEETFDESIAGDAMN
ncbi:MAG: ATP-dependent Clp protease adaptor ClpS [Myxococcota bacterium]